jgi:hypothetical protein
VREDPPPDAARQLAGRLGIAVLTSDDVAALEEFHPTDLPITHPAVARLFDRQKVAKYLAAFTGLDKRLKPLLEYRQFDYFVYEPHRNPLQLVAHLHEAKARLDPKNPLHVALFMDMAWLYLVTITQIVEHVRAAHLTDPDTATQEYLFGGQLGLREKRQIAVRVRVRAAFAGCYDEIAAKLLTEVCGFLVGAADLDAGFRVEAKRILLDDADPEEPEKANPQLSLDGGG